MKVRCWCGIEGVFQQRGSSLRVQHYLGFKDGRRLYQYHRIEKIPVEVNGSKPLEVKDFNSASDSQNRRAGSSVWYERLIRNQEAAGSNPAQST